MPDRLKGMRAVQALLAAAWQKPVTLYGVSLLAVLDEGPLPIERIRRSCKGSRTLLLGWAAAVSRERPGLLDAGCQAAPRELGPTLVRLAVARRTPRCPTPPLPASTSPEGDSMIVGAKDILQALATKGKKVSIRTLYTYARAGMYGDGKDPLPLFRLGADVAIEEADLDAWLVRQRRPIGGLPTAAEQG